MPFPFGLALGHANDRAEQQAVLDAAFSTLAASGGPVLIDYVAPTNEAGTPPQVSEVALDGAALAIDFATEVTLMRRYWEQRYAATGRTSVGVSKVPPHRFRGIVRFLEGYVAGEAADCGDRAADVELPAFVVHCATDLRALYVEARMQTHPNEPNDERQRWLLGGTALGAVLRKLNDRMLGSDDPKTVAAARGIAR